MPVSKRTAGRAPAIGAAAIRAGELGARSGKDRVGIDRTHIVGSIDPVNPVYRYKVEQIHGR